LNEVLDGFFQKETGSEALPVSFWGFLEKALGKLYFAKV